MRIALLMCVCTAVIFGQKKGKTLHAHEHGAVKLNIAVEGNTAVVELESPAETITGFEYKAKSAADQKRQSAALDLLKAQIANIVILDPKSGCRFTPKKAEVILDDDGDGEHSEVRAEFSVACSQPLAGTKVRFAFTKFFPRIHSIAVQALSGSQQADAQIKQDEGSITLGR